MAGLAGREAKAGLKLGEGKGHGVLEAVKDVDFFLSGKDQFDGMAVFLKFQESLTAHATGSRRFFNKIDPGEPTEINIYELTEEEREARGIEVLPTSLWEAYHSLEEDPLILNALGPHVSEKFLELKYQEWDEYRVQVFGYEQRKYLDI